MYQQAAYIAKLQFVLSAGDRTAKNEVSFDVSDRLSFMDQITTCMKESKAEVVVGVRCIPGD